VAIFFTIELLRLVEGLRSDIIHGDLKIDNCLVRLEEIPSAAGGKNAWSAQYDRRGCNGWSYKGVRLIDFGRAADLSLFLPAGNRRLSPTGRPTSVTASRCAKDVLGALRPTTLACQHLLLPPVWQDIATEAVETDEGRRYKIDAPLKRVSDRATRVTLTPQYWQTELWSKLFDTLLNPRTLRRWRAAH
jgi:checkpoint serine/threonine-protein kinase